jgi:hypothetical protein
MAVQRALLLSHSKNNGMLLYCKQLSSSWFVNTVQEAKQKTKQEMVISAQKKIEQGAENVT